MITTGRMSYGSPPHPHEHPSRSPRGGWRLPLALFVIAVVLGLSSGWVGQNWRTFDSNADIGLCHLTDGRC